MWKSGVYRRLVVIDNVVRSDVARDIAVARWYSLCYRTFPDVFDYPVVVDRFGDTRITMVA